MKTKRFIIFAALLAVVMTSAFSTTVFAVTESEVQAQVTVHGKEGVSGNLFIWFLCAVAFLKISQKIDSFMSSLGVNVGNTGGSMMAELLIAGRGISSGKNIFSGGFGGRGSRGAPGASGSNGTDSGSGGFMSGGLAGAVSRSFNRGAVKNATDGEGGGIGGAMFESSMEKGGEFANDIIGSVAKGSITATGTMTGDNAASALSSYLGYTPQTGQTESPDAAPTEIPSFSHVEIGGGRIMGTETSTENPNGIRFGMYSTDQYMTPEGRYETVKTADGAQWYKQYAQDTVEKTPYMAPDGSIAYNESLIQKLPDMPRRKDRV
jgi:hypothetical protein